MGIVTDLAVKTSWNVASGFKNTFTITVTESSVAYSLASRVFSLQIRKTGEESNFINLTEGSGITNGGASGILTIVLTAAQSATLGRDNYFWQLTCVTDETRWLSGTVEATTGVYDGDTATALSASVSLTGTALTLEISLPGASAASGITFSATGTIASTNVQDAIAEVATDAIAREAALIAQTITNGVTTSAPSENAVYDALALKADLASPTFTGTPAAPTAAGSVGSTQLATTAFLKAKAEYWGTYNLKDYGAVGDVKKVTDAAITTGTPNLTSATGLFTSADAGKTIVVWGAGAAGGALLTTILTFVSATAVTLASNAGTTVSGKKAYWGTDDTAAFTAAITACPTTGSTLIIPAQSGEGYLVTSGLTVDKNIIIQGQGSQPYTLFPSYTGPSTPPFRGASTIYFTSPTADLFTFQANVSTNNYPVFSVTDLSMENVAGSTPTAGTAIKVTGKLGHWNILRCYIGRFYDNLHFAGGMLGVVERCSIVKPVRSGAYINASATPDLGGFWFYKNYFFGNVDEASAAKGIWFVAGGAVTVFENNFNTMDYSPPTTDTYGLKYGYYADGSTIATSEHSIINNHFNNYQETAIYMRPGTNILQRIIISNNSINAGNNGGLLREAIYITNVPQLVVEGNQIAGLGSSIAFAAIRITQCAGVSLGANWIGTNWLPNDLTSSTILADITNSTNLGGVPTAFSFHRAVSTIGLTGFLGYSGSGTGAGVGFRTGTTLNDPSQNYTTFGMLGASFTTSGFLKAKSGFVEANAGSNFIISNFANDDIIFATNSRLERARITGAGYTSFGGNASTVGETRYLELTGNGANYRGWKVPSSVSADIVYEIPAAPTNNGELLTSTTAGVMSFATGITAATATGIAFGTAGQGIAIKTGTNATAGTAVLVGGTVTVSTTKVSATSVIIITSQVDGGTPGFLRITTKTNGTSFVITSSSGTDTSTVGWWILDAN